MSTKLAALVSVLADKPLDESKKDWLVNREREVNYLKNVVSHLPFGILGVAGETGIGKTTVLNFVRPSNVFVLMVNISLRDTMESILYDLLYSISSKLEMDKDVGNYSKECKEWVSKEVATLKGFSLGVTLFANAGTKFGKSIAPRFNFFVAREKLGNLIKKAVQSKGKFVLIIDELDKEKKEDVLKVIDALKAELLSENLIVIFSLPFAIYREYVADRMRWNEAGNLENVFKDIVFLEPMKPLEVKEMLIRRLKDYLELVDTEALELASDFSDGNPRDALWILSKSVYDNISEKKLEKHHVLNTIRKVVNEYFSTGFSLTENQKKAINLLKDFKGPREKILKILQENGFKRTTAYSVLNQLIEKRFLIIREGNYKISGKFKFVDF